MCNGLSDLYGSWQVYSVAAFYSFKNFMLYFSMQFLQQLPFLFLFLQKETKLNSLSYSERAGEWQKRRKAFISSFLAAVFNLVATKYNFIEWYRLERTSKGHLVQNPTLSRAEIILLRVLSLSFESGFEYLQAWTSVVGSVLILISALLAAACLNVQRKKRRHSKCSAFCSTPVLSTLFPITRS